MSEPRVAVLTPILPVIAEHEKPARTHGTNGFWRRVRDLTPRWGISPHTISRDKPRSPSRFLRGYRGLAGTVSAPTASSYYVCIVVLVGGMCAPPYLRWVRTKIRKISFFFEPQNRKPKNNCILKSCCLPKINAFTAIAFAASIMFHVVRLSAFRAKTRRKYTLGFCDKKLSR